MDEIELFQILAERFVASEPASFGERDIERAFLIRERPEPGVQLYVAPGGTCPCAAQLFLSALPRGHKRAWRTVYEEANVNTGARETARCICVDVSDAAERLFRFLERNSFEGEAETLTRLYLAEKISA